MTDSINSLKKRIPYCPLLSAGCNGSLQICLQEKCAWWQASTKTCVAYVIGHNCVLNIKEKQGK